MLPRNAASPAASSEKQVAQLRDFVDHALKKQVGKPPFVPDMLFGTGGTFTALAAMIMARQGQAGQPMWGFRVTRAAIRHLVADLAANAARTSLESDRPQSAIGPISLLPGWRLSNGSCAICG